MTRTASLRAQFQAAEDMFDEIFAGIVEYKGDEDAFPLSLKLARLAGILRTGFAIESHALYPPLLASDHRQAAIIGRIFYNELHQLSARFDRFVERWSSSTAIAASLGQFEYEAGMMFAAIRDRVHRANRELYPVVDVVAKLGDLRVQAAGRRYPRAPRAAVAS